MTKENINRPSRPKRVPIGLRNRFEVSNKDEKFHYRIVNDVEDRIARFKEAGYEPVLASETQLTSNRVQASQEGSIASMQVGGGVTGVLMKIPKEWYEEDRKQGNDARAAAIEEGIKNPTLDGSYGSIKVSR